MTSKTQSGGNPTRLAPTWCHGQNNKTLPHHLKMFANGQAHPSSLTWSNWVRNRSIFPNADPLQRRWCSSPWSCSQNLAYPHSLSKGRWYLRRLLHEATGKKPPPHEACIKQAKGNNKLRTFSYLSVNTWLSNSSIHRRGTVPGRIEPTSLCTPKPPFSLSCPLWQMPTHWY